MDSNSNQTPNTWQSSSIKLLSSDQINIRPPGVFMKEQGLTLEENAGEPSKPSKKQKLKEKKLRKKLDELKGLTDMLFLIIVAVLLLCLLAYYDTKKPKNFPPGPKWWPILGSAPQIASIQKRTNHFVYATSELAKKYGPILGLKVGTEVIVIVNGYAANKEFLLSEDLSGRPIGEFFDKRTWGKRRGILLVDQHFWQEQRRFFLKQLREFGFGTKSMSMSIEEEAQELVQYILRTINQNDSVVFNVHNMFNLHILNCLWKMLAGVRYMAEDAKMRELQSILNELFQAVSMVGATFSHFPILKYIAPEKSGYNVYVKNHKLIWDFIRKEIAYHKSTHNPHSPRDVMDVYLNVLKSEDGKSVGESFSEDQLVATCMDMFMAGSETTSNTLSFAVLYLILYPEVQKKAQAEIDYVIGKCRTPCLADRPRMPYLECVVLESLRMFGGRAFTVPHRALRDTYLCGYRIPKDVLVIANLYGCMLEEGCEYENPDVFKPERFLENGKIFLPDSFIPFGIGKHRCLGESLARANVFIFLAVLLQNFDLNICPEHPPTTEWIDGVTPGPKPFKARITPRKI
ncbi:methyl farnesoate epoxidase-like isoform X3 [Diabrotica undecimpunctata]|uniref:methyl farnesoate epoxidase-like isoform X3 n=1 Tax=Diabrotica undecimpunctata TaxID=50387 RepID=UPI003B63FFA9